MKLSRHLQSRLERIDWDFTGAPSESPFSALHWHPARLPSQVAAACIGLLSDPGDTVLDPFLGSGTTLVEAQRLGRPSVGFDLNPVACLIAQAKTLAVPSGKVREASQQLKRKAIEILSGPLMRAQRAQSEPPSSVQRKWYTPAVLNHLSALWVYLQQCEGLTRSLGLMAFSGSLLPVCRETRHWGYVCDNTMPKADHAGDVLLEFCELLDRLCSAYRTRDEDLTNNNFGLVEANSKCIDSRVAVSELKPRSVRLVMTSPPYSGVSDYVKSQRLTMEWLGSAIEPVRLLEIGARSKRHRKTATEEYLDDLHMVFARILPSLDPRGACVIVLGESSKRSAYVRSFQDRLKKSGYAIAYEATRTISQQRRQYASIESETITVAVPR